MIRTYTYIYISMARAREGKYVSRIVRRIGNKHGFTQCQRSFRVVSWLAFGNKQRAKTFYDPSPPVQTATALKQSTALQLRRGIVAARDPQSIVVAFGWRHGYCRYTVPHSRYAAFSYAIRFTHSETVRRLRLYDTFQYRFVQELTSS